MMPTSCRSQNCDASRIVQLAARDAQLTPLRLQEFCHQTGIANADSSRAISWLVAQRLFLSDADCRCPHQRFALVVLGRILEGQDDAGRATISGMLSAVVRDPTFPTAGLRILLHEIKFLGDYRQWTGLIPAQSLEPLIARCWNAKTADEWTFAALRRELLCFLLCEGLVVVEQRREEKRRL